MLINSKIACIRLNFVFHDISFYLGDLGSYHPFYSQKKLSIINFFACRRFSQNKNPLEKK